MSKTFVFVSPKKSLSVTAIIDNIQMSFTGLERLALKVTGLHN